MVTGILSRSGVMVRLFSIIFLLLSVHTNSQAQEGSDGATLSAPVAKQPAKQAIPQTPQLPVVTTPVAKQPVKQAVLPQSQQPAVAIPQPSTPVELAIQGILKEGVNPKLHWSRFSDFQKQLDALYQLTGYAPLWLHDDKPTSQARAAVASLSEADDNGLNSSDYDAQLLNKWIDTINSSTNLSPQELATFDSALSISLIRYASNLYRGRINPKHVNFALEIEPKNEDLAALLRKMSTSNNLSKLLSNLEPKLGLYYNMKKALVHYRQLAKEPGVGPIILPNKFKLGDHNADVPKVRKLLSLLGDLNEGNPSDVSQTYDKPLAEAIKRFQSRHGLTPDGIIGKTTLTEFNVPVTERVKQLQLGLERLRWLPDQINGRYILVNVPSFQLYGYHNGSGVENPDLIMNVIVGEAIDGRSTPVFHSDMTYVNFRPYWNVPDTIAAKEYVPILRRNPGYLGRNNMEIVPNFALNANAYAATKGNIEALASGSLKLRQKPGPKNALGLVKFTFPNTNNVYLHSTPNQGLFKRTRRDFSHGCIRVEYPLRLAEFVLKDHEEWTTEKIDSAMHEEKPKIVTLKTPIPVYITYSTVMADAAGQAMFYNDIYGHDPILIEQLSKGFPYAP